jgi:excisionase family DNA binding protein
LKHIAVVSEKVSFPMVYGFKGSAAKGDFMYLNETKVSAILGINKKTVRRLIESGRLRAVDVGSSRHCYRIDPEDLKNISPAKPLASSMPPPARRRFRRQGVNEIVQSFLPSV